MTDPIRVVGYLRVSTEKQAEEGNGIAYQRRGIEVWAARNNVEVVTFYTDEGVSGSEEVDKRTGLPLALGTLDYADGLVVWKLDRLARDPILQEMLYREITTRGKRLFSTWEGEQQMLDDPNDPSREFIRTIMGAMARYESKMIAARMRAGKIEKRSKGGYIGGEPPYGTRSVGNGELEINEEEKVVLDRMIELRVEGLGYRRIAEKLNAEGYRARKGGPWWDRSVHGILTRVVPSLCEHRGPKYGNPGAPSKKKKPRKGLNVVEVG